MNPIPVDFETEAIVDYRAPKPVGVAIGEDYYAFGHPTGNNCTEATAKAALRRIWHGHLVFHNAPFDVSVAHEHWDFPIGDPLRLHDTMVLAALNPKSAWESTLALKPLAESWLGEPPEEQDLLKQWIEVNLKKQSNHGSYISQVPGNIVEPYALGDNNRTRDLFDLLREHVGTRAYQRYQKLFPVMYRMVQRGIRLDSLSAAQRGHYYEEQVGPHRDYLEVHLGRHTNLDSPAQVLASLIEEGLVDVNRLLKTKKGALSASEKSLQQAIIEPELFERLAAYRSARKVDSSFLTPWSKLAFGGKLHPQYRWIGATKTGRLSSSKPNIQQVPKELREFLLPYHGRWVSFDYSQQELRILAHLSGRDSRLARYYQQDPNADLHQIVAYEMGISRRHAKAVNFGMIYGQGAKGLGEGLKIPYDVAKAYRAMYFERYPSVRKWIRGVMERADRERVQYTIGGRGVLAERRQPQPDPNPLPSWARRGDGPPLLPPVETVSYRVPNKLIQGSGGDMICDALIEADNVDDCILLNTVHDELNVSTDSGRAKLQVYEAMMDVAQLDVPMVVDVTEGPNWKEQHTCMGPIRTVVSVPTGNALSSSSSTTSTSSSSTAPIVPPLSEASESTNSPRI